MTSFRHDVKWARSIDFVHLLAKRHDWRRFAVEFVLDRAYQLLKHVFKGHHSSNAAVFVEQHRQMNPIALKFEQKLVEPQADGQKGDFTGYLPQVGAPVLIGSASENVLDVNHPDHV